MIKMIPEVISPEVKSTAEKNLFKYFKECQSDDNMIILHSLGVAEHNNNIFGEIDFVIICSQGFLCVEVKGGAVNRTSGNWTFTNRYGKMESKQQGPFEQAQGNMQSLRQYMKRKFGETHPFTRAQYSCCVLMPDCNFTAEGFDIIPEILFDRSDGTDLSEILTRSFNYWREDLHSKHGVYGGNLTDEEIQQAADLLRGDFRFVPSLRDVIGNTYQELLALTEEQYSILEALEDNPRLLISGLAGTGKSVLAVEECKRACRCGKDVLYLCFNKNMAGYAGTQFKKEFLNVEAGTLHSQMMKACGIKNFDGDSRFFSVTLPEKFLEEDTYTRKYDLVVIDEGQDLINDTYLKCISKLIKGGLREGSWTIYYDPNQNIFNVESEMASVLPKIKQYAASYSLTINCRNTKEIANTNTLITNIPQVNRIKASGPSVEQISYHSISDEKEKIESLIRKLHSEGVSNGDIVLQSPYTADNRCCFMSLGSFSKDIGEIRSDGRLWISKKEELRFATISSFKGLESKVVILCDVDSFAESSRKLLNYVAISRAETALFIFYNENAEKERQQMMLAGYQKLK